MKAKALTSLFLMLSSASAMAQTVKPASKTAGHSVKAAGAAIAIVPAAHEVPAAVLNGEVKGTESFASGVTQSSAAASNAVSKTGGNIQRSGISAKAVSPIAAVPATIAPTVTNGAVTSAKNIRGQGVSAVRPTGVLSAPSQRRASDGVKNTTEKTNIAVKSVADPQCNAQSVDFPTCLTN